MKKLLIALAAIAVFGGLAFANSSTDYETTDEPTPGVNCTLADGTTFGTVADMLKFLKDRDGHFQMTVETYSQFKNVGDLLKQKCATPADE